MDLKLKNSSLPLLTEPKHPSEFKTKIAKIDKYNFFHMMASQICMNILKNYNIQK